MKGETMMSWDQLKKKVAGAAVLLVLLLGSGLIGGTTAQAQFRNRDWRGRIESAREREWRREQERRRWERQRERDRGGFIFRRSIPYGYGGTYGYNSYDEQKGYRDGLDRGQEDARDRRSFNPNNSSHYRSGNAAYRAGFRRGYDIGYRQYAGYRRW